MVGGDAAVVAYRVTPVLSAFGKRVIHTGRSAAATP